MIHGLVKSKGEFILFDFLFWFLLAIIFPVATGHFTFLNILHIFLYLGAAYYLGEYILFRIDIIKDIPFMYKSGIYILFGSLICGIIYLFIPSSIVLYALSLLWITDLVINKRLQVSFSFRELLCLIPFFIIIFQTYELVYATTERYSHQDGDYFFYTAVVESLKTNQSLGNAVYHTGIPINYMSLPFLAPAQLASFSGISSQFALWGVYSKLVPVICFGTISYTVVKIYEWIFKRVEDRKSFLSKQLFVAFLLLFLGPLHILNILKFDFKNSRFFGEGLVMPIGSPGLALSMFLAGLLFLLVFSKDSYSRLEKCVIIILLVFISSSKLAMFLPIGALLGTLSVLWMFKKRTDLFITLLLALPFCILVYKLTVGGSGSIYGPLEITAKGYYYYYFSELANKYGINGDTTLKAFLMFCISIFMWLSIKLVIFALSLYSLKNNFKAISFILASIFGLIISILPGFFIRTYGKDINGTILFDDSFNTAQFVRGSIFLLTVAVLVFALYLVYLHKNLLIRKASFVILCVWMLLISFSFINYDYISPVAADQTWYKEVRQDYLKKKPALMAMVGSLKYSGQTLTTAGVHPWYITGARKDEDGCFFTLEAYNRSILFEKIFDSSITLPGRKLIADSIKTKGVDCIVASPFSLKKIQFAEKDSLISSIPGTRWFYRLN